MEISHASITDLDLLVPMFDEYRQCYEQASDPEAARKFLSERLNEKQCFIILGTEDGIGVGFIIIFLSYSAVSMDKIYIFTDLFVNADYRKKGVAKQLMHYAIEFAASTSSTGLVIETRITNQSASKLFYDVGFQKDGDRMLYYLEL